MQRTTRLTPSSFVLGFSVLVAAASTSVACGDDDGEDTASGGTSSGGRGGSSSKGGAGGAGNQAGADNEGGTTSEAGSANEGGTTSEAGSANEGGTTGEAGSANEAGAENEGGTTAAAGSGNEAGGGSEEDALYVTGGWLTTPDDEYVGYLSVVADISASGTVDLARAVEFPGDIVYASPGDGSVYVVLATEPTIQRWVLDEDDELTLDGELGLAQYGIADGVRKSAPVFVAPDRAYYFDHDTLQLVVWNPSTMQTLQAIVFDGLEEEGFGMRTNYLHRDGERLLVSASYWRLTDEEGYLKLNRVAIFDMTSNAVIYTDDERCGGVAFQATDASGNLYFASHPGHAAALAAGMGHTEGVSEPAASCLLRIETGSSEFDPDYYVDLNELSGGFTGGIMQGPGDQAYVLTYDGPELTPSDYFRAPRADAWAIHRVTLGDEADTYAAVPGMPLVSAYGFAFATVVAGENTPFIITVNGDFSEGTYYDASDASSFERALTVPGSPGPAIRIR